jgi:Cu(I)/Ag(I) efflux system membrane protein CusA/SilA
MIARLIALSARNRAVVFLFVLLVSAWGIWAIRHAPLDAIPDLSDTQVIVYTEWAGRSPDLVEDQVTYPITTTLLAAPKVQVVRGYSFLGSSFIYVIFEDGTDIYWARSRVLEYLQSVREKLPRDASPVLGPDASSVGWGFSYAVVDNSGRHDLSQLRTLQDWNVKLALESVPGVSQVASVGGFVRQYQVQVDPNRLLAYNIPLKRVTEAVARSNRDVEGRVLELSGIEYAVRGRGYVRSLEDLERIAVGTGEDGTPVLLRDVARVQLGPEIRRGLAELDGKGEVAAGIVVVRFGENVLDVIDRVKAKIEADVQPSLPEGVKIVTTYDRSDLIRRAVGTLTDEIVKLCVVVSAVCVVFLLHWPSALVIVCTLPVAILAAFVCMYHLGVTSNIMSLGGIAIAIGAMVDASIVMVENAHKRLEEWEARGRPGDRLDVLIGAAQEVGPSLFFSLLVITVGFLPVFTLQAQAGRLFRPLAYTKTFAMLFASFLAVTLTPALMTVFLRGKIRPEEKNPVSTFLHRLYDPVVRFVLARPKSVIAAAAVLVAVTFFPFVRLGTEFMPPLYEGSLFYMPVTVPGPSISEVSRLLQLQDRILMGFPEVEQVFGKAGRAETATDPAPLEMFETVINLKPESEWREGMTVDRLVRAMDNALAIPGVSNSFTMPIKARIDMLSTGIRTPLGIKVMGPRLDELERIGIAVEKVLRTLPETRNVYAERVNTGYYLDFAVRRDDAARYGLAVDDVLDVVKSAVGGENLTTVLEGRERYPVNVRYKRDLRGDVQALRRVLVPVGDGADGKEIAQVPMEELADIRIVKGPSSIRSEEGVPTSYVYIDFAGGDVNRYVLEGKRRLAESVKLPNGYRLEWSGDYEYLAKTREKLMVVVPLTGFLILILLYLNTRSLPRTAIVLLAVPFSLVGSFWLLYLLGYQMSIAVWVGVIALAGLDAETGIVMLLYLEMAYDRWKREGKLTGVEALKEAIHHGAVQRLRPKLMTVGTTFLGLLPILFSTGTGSDVMKRIAAPMVGGLVTSALLELAVYPAIYLAWRGREFRAPAGGGESPAGAG